MSVFVMPVENNRKGSSAFGISARTKLNKELLYLSSLFNEKSQTTTKGNKTRMCQILGGIGKSQDFHIKKRLFHYFRNRKKKEVSGFVFVKIYHDLNFFMQKWLPHS